MKKTIFSILAIITLCSLLAAAAYAEELPRAAAPAGSVVTVRAKKADPVEGSWILHEVYEVTEDTDPVLLKKEENQSLYGSGIGIYTFFGEGFAYHHMIDGGGSLDEDAVWETAGPDAYAYTEGEETLLFSYVKEEDALYRTFADGTRTLEFVYARAFTGSWTLDQVMEIREGDAPVDLPREENQSLYGEGESVLTFYPDSKAQEKITEGGGQTVTEGEWRLTAPDSFTYLDGSLNMEFQYFRLDDTIYRDDIDEAPDAAHPHLRFVYTRVIRESQEEEQETTAAQPEPVWEPDPYYEEETDPWYGFEPDPEAGRGPDEEDVWFEPDPEAGPGPDETGYEFEPDSNPQLDVGEHIHNWKRAGGGDPPNCLYPGHIIYYCTICYAEHVELEPALAPDEGHNFEAVEYVPPTCTEEGYCKYKCTRCLDSYTDYFPAEGHDLVFDHHTDPTCGNNGYDTYVCSVCGQSYTRDPELYPPTGDHIWVNVHPTSWEPDVTHTWECANCMQILTEPHDGEHACSICGWSDGTGY